MILCKRRTYFLFIFLTLIILNLFGQDAHYSQFYANPLYLNPAFAGANNCPRFSLNFRDQWPAIKGNYIAFSGSYDQHINVLHGGIGVLVAADIEGRGINGSGIMNTYNASAIYNFRVKVTHKFNLQFALQGGYLTSYINWEGLHYASGAQGLPPPDYPALYDYKKKSQFDAAFGFTGYTSYLYFGMAIHHLFPVRTSFFSSSNDKYQTVWQPKYTAHIGGKITILQKNRTEINTGDIFLYPNLVFISQGNFDYLHEGFYFNFYPFTIGAWLRHNFKNFDACIVSCGIEYKLLRIGYSYDFTLTQLEGTGGAHEVSLQITIPCDNDNRDRINSKKKKKMDYAPLDCPRF
ncbi:MAG: PorP/SprF family type IX secretion system membrane protein [Bacteroidetes bacterium]|nr:PorP/SprF family type IX secretion system membrane protein [Bacteroidota bacterium]MCL1968721.1 PorP/SprF family type IX secretion system membrane protein [Bacteroidota bacterium]